MTESKEKSGKRSEAKESFGNGTEVAGTGGAGTEAADNCLCKELGNALIGKCIPQY